MTIALSPRPSAPPAAPPSAAPKRRGRWPAIVALSVGVVLVAAAVIWRSFAVPALVKFPTDVDQNPRYEGTFVLFVDPATAAPLDEPMTADLAVNRHIEALPAESGAHEVVVRETITFEVAGLPEATQVHQYVMDRSTNVNLNDERAWAFENSNVLDRAGAYWIAMPADVDTTSPVPMYKDEIGATFTAVGGPAMEEIDGLDLVGFEANLTSPQPLTEAYLDRLDAVVPLPRSLTFDQLRPSLLAAGLAVDEAMAAVAESATPDDLATLAELIGEPIPLEYVIEFSGHTFVEPQTGAIVDVSSVVDRVSARPAGEAISALVNILERYRDDPAIAATIDALNGFSTQPLPVFEYRYAQAPDSVEEIASWVSEQRDRMDLAERMIPLVLGLTGSICVGAGVLLLLRNGVAAKEMWT
jgi:hypothetical protein